jgi:hypothetical protein
MFMVITGAMFLQSLLTRSAEPAIPFWIGVQKMAAAALVAWAVYRGLFEARLRSRRVRRGDRDYCVFVLEPIAAMTRLVTKAAWVLQLCCSAMLVVLGAGISCFAYCREIMTGDRASRYSSRLSDWASVPGPSRGLPMAARQPCLLPFSCLALSLLLSSFFT